MPQVDRFSVSLDTELLAAFDRHIAAKGYDNRSEAIRDMIRDLLTSDRLDGDDDVSALLTLMCDHQVGDAARRLRASLVRHADKVQGTLVVALDADRDRVAIALRGSGDSVRAASDEIMAIRGIAHGHLAAVPVASPMASSL